MRCFYWKISCVAFENSHVYTQLSLRSAAQLTASSSSSSSPCTSSIQPRTSSPSSRTISTSHKLHRWLNIVAFVKTILLTRKA